MRCILPLSIALLLATFAVADTKDQKTKQGGFFEDPVRPLQPKNPRSEAETDRVIAAAYFTQGRVLFQRGDLPGALRAYQRTYRYDPGATSVLGDIVSISFRLNHQFEAYRYAALAAEKTSNRRQLVFGMAQYLADQNKLNRAITLYRKGLKLPNSGKDTVIRDLAIELECGRLCFLAQRYADAGKHFDTFRKTYEDSKSLRKAQRDRLLRRPARTYSMFGLAYLFAKRHTDAEKMFRQVNKLDPSPGRLAYHLARVAFANKDYKSTRKWLDEYLQLKATVSGNSPYQLLGQLLTATIKDQKKAEQEFLSLLGKNYAEQPKNVDLGLLLAARHFAANNLDTAAGLFQKLLATPRKDTAREGLLQVATKQKKAEVLLEQMTESVVTSKDFRPLSPSGRLISQHPNLVKQIFQLANKKNGKSIKDQLWTPLAVGLLALEAKQFNEATRFLTKALKHQKAARAEVLLSWALSLMTKKTARQSIPLLKRVIEEKLRQKDEPSIMLQLATAHFLAGDKEKARQVARQAAALAPKKLAVRTEYAGVLFRMRALAEAETEFLRIIKAHDKDHRSSESRGYVQQARLVLSTICVLSNRLSEGEEWLEQVLDEYPDHVGACNDLGYLWCDQGKHLNRSLRMVRYAVKNEPRNAAYRDSLGWAHYRLGHFSAAVKELKEAVKLSGNSPDAVILDHLGDAHLKLGQKQEAKAAYQRAAAAFDETETDKKLATQKKLKKLK